MTTSYRHPGVYIRELPILSRSVVSAPTSIAAFVGRTAAGPVDEAQRITAYEQFGRVFGGLDADSDLSYAVSHFFLNGGDTCWIVRSSGADGNIGSRASRSGIYALESVENFNILCLPDVHEVAALAEAAAYAEQRRAMLIVDIDPRVATFDQAQRWISNTATEPLKNRNSAAYFPRVQLADPLRGGEVRAFPNSGVMAGLWARTDRTRGVWQAPAGPDAELQGVQALACQLSDAESGVLNPLALNSLRSFPGRGALCWGARTLIGADAHGSEWKYIPVRRTALLIEQSLYDGTRFAASEPNGEPLWARIRQAVDGFMNALYRQGAFQGSSPREAFFVKCDATTTTAADVGDGRVNILVGFAPMKPAEFVTVAIQQRAGPGRA